MAADASTSTAPESAAGSTAGGIAGSPGDGSPKEDTPLPLSTWIPGFTGPLVAGSVRSLKNQSPASKPNKPMVNSTASRRPAMILRDMLSG
jgi:hypothetical protein